MNDTLSVSFFFLVVSGALFSEDMTKYVIGKETFSSKKDISRHAAKLLGAYSVDQTLSLTDQEWFMALFCHRKSEKRLHDVSGCKVAESHGNKYVLLIYKDGSQDDISIVRSVADIGNARTEKTGQSGMIKDFKRAMRDEVSHQIAEFRMANYSPSHNSEKMHVDHVIHFDTLVQQFCTKMELVAENVSIEKGRLGSKRLVDRKLADNWQKYHLENAMLRMITATENLTRKKPPRVPKQHNV